MTALTLFIFNTFMSSNHSCCPTVHLGAELPYEKQIACLSQEESNYAALNVFLCLSSVPDHTWVQNVRVSPLSHSLRTLLGVPKALLKFPAALRGPSPLAVFCFAWNVFSLPLLSKWAFWWLFLSQLLWFLVCPLLIFIFFTHSPHSTFRYSSTFLCRFWYLLLLHVCQKLFLCPPKWNLSPASSRINTGNTRASILGGSWGKLGQCLWDEMYPAVVAFLHCVKIWKVTEKTWEKSICTIWTLLSPFLVTLTWWKVATCFAPWGASSAILYSCIGYCE